MQGQVRFDGNISMRLAGPGDKAFLSTLFHQTRDFIYEYADAEDDYKHFVVEQQEGLRETGYGGDYPNSMDFVIEDTGVAIGRVQIDFTDNLIHVLDVAIQKNARGRGVGETVLRGIQRTATASGAPVTLSCARNNLAARRLYAKLGFELHQSGSMHDRLIWHPPSKFIKAGSIK